MTSTLLAIANPSLSSARMTSAPETRGNLGGIRGNVEGRHQRLAIRLDWKFFQVQLGRLAQVGQGFCYRLALAGTARLRIQCHKAALLRGDQHGGELHRNLLACFCPPASTYIRRCRLSDPGALHT